MKRILKRIYFYFLPSIISSNYLRFKFFHFKYDSLVGEINKSADKIYEQKEINIIKEICAGIPGPVIVDVGANIGLMSLNLYEYIPHSKIYAFEPGPFQFSLLKRTIKYNNLLDRIQVYNCAVSDSKAEVEFHVHSPSDSSGDGFKDTGRAGESKVIKVNTITLDHWWSDSNKPNVNLVKIDTEGSEILVLRGAKNLLLLSKPVIIIEICYLNYEKYNYLFVDFINTLKELNYILFDLKGENEITIENHQSFIDQFYYRALPEGKA